MIIQYQDVTPFRLEPIDGTFIINRDLYTIGFLAMENVMVLLAPSRMRMNWDAFVLLFELCSLSQALSE